MKNIFIFYISLMVPFAILISFLDNESFSPWIPIALLIVWALLYAPWITGLRLFQKGIIPKRKLVWITIANYPFFREVYLKR